jgi:hypothetical protein
MFANVHVFRAGQPAAGAQCLSIDLPVQRRMAVFAAANLAVVAASFSIENALWPWQARMDTATPGWCFVLAQAGVLGFVVALAIRGGPLAVTEALLSATLVGYAYVLAGVWLIDPRRSVQLAHLIFRAVQLGLVGVGSMALGITLRMMLGQRVALDSTAPPGAGVKGQYHLGELMFIVVVIAVGLGLANLFVDHFARESQLGEIVLSILRSLPAALPWLWGLLQRRLSWPVLGMIVVSSVLLLLAKSAIAYAWTGEEFGAILELSIRRAVAYAVAATINGLMLRGLGFRWEPG